MNFTYMNVGNIMRKIAGQKNLLLLATLAGLLFFYQPALAAQFNISIGDNYFSPFAPMVAPGDTVVWTNTGNTSHTVSADNGSFDSGSLAPGGTYSHTFTQVGVINYYSSIDSTPANAGGNKMNAVILVNANAPASGTGGSNSTSTGVQYTPTDTGTEATSTPSSTPTGLQMNSGSENNNASNYPVGQVGYPSGSLVNDNGTIYLIPFTNYQAFIGLGYSAKNVVVGSTQGFSLSTYAITSSRDAHPWGSWLLYKGTVYYNHQTGLIGVPSYDVFTSDGGNDSIILPANAADIVVLNNPGNNSLPILQTNDTRLY
jgi:plastocyanin